MIEYKKYHISEERMTDTEKIRKKCASLLYKTKIPSRHDAEELYSTLSESDISGLYFWRDIDYTDNNPAQWCANKHHSRILTILRGYGEKKLRDGEFVKKIVGAVKFWLHHDFKNSNWWYNEIGIPLGFADIGIMIYDAVDDEARSAFATIVSNGSMTNLPNAFSPPNWDGRWIGANLIWTAGITIKYALLTGDVDTLRYGIELASRELCVGAVEGIQSDGSFFQHARLLYSGGYGRSFAYSIAQLAYILDGTQYQFPREKLDIFLTHILDGLRHMTVGGYLDWQCVGREYVRPGMVAVNILKDAVKLMAKTEDMPRGDEISEYLAEICGTRQKEDGTKYFDVAHTLCHRSHGIYVGTRFVKSGLRSSEICNDENLLGANLGYGTTTCIMKRGDEYYNIAPIWNYSRIPGTTSRTQSDEELRANPDWSLAPYPSDVGGGAQKGSRALVYEQCIHDGVEALCAYFAFEDGFVCLGTGIRDTSGKNEALVTTIDQRRIFGEMFEADFAFYIDGICYMTLDGKDIVDRTQKVVGKWTRNNPNHGDNEEVTDEVLTLEIHHKAGEESSYAYLICEEDNEPEIEVLRNDKKAQAIRLPDGSVMAVVYEKTELCEGGKVYDCGTVIEECAK